MYDNELLPFGNIDRLLLVELREPNHIGGVIPKLYPIARGNGDPLSYVTAKAFIDRPKSKIGIVTGVEEAKYMPHGEIDGLPGAVILGRALGRLGHEVYILTEEGCVQVIDSLIKELGATKTKSVNVSHLTNDEILAMAKDMDMGVAIEKIGVNRKGITHTIEGKSFDQKPGPFYADIFIESLNKQGKYTIGYGDGGNEIGFGKIFDQGRDLVPFGTKCQCPCGDGMFTSTATTTIWPVNVSNFGAYGTVAGLAILSDKADLALTPEELLKALIVSVAAGAVDGGNGKLYPGEDGIPDMTAAAYVKILKNIVDKVFQEFKRDF